MRFGGLRQEVRGSALWGSGKRGTGSRGNALWGSGKRRTALLATLVLTLAVPFGASAGSSGPEHAQAFVTPSLLSSASASPAASFSVIVQGKGGNQAAKALADLLGGDKKAYKNFDSIDGLAVELTGAQIEKLATDSHVTAITPDARVRLSGENDKWPYVVGAQKYWGSSWSSPAPAATIAIIDSGIDAVPRGLRQPCHRQRQPERPFGQLGRGRPRPRHDGCRDRSRRGQLAERVLRLARRSSRSTSWTTRAWRARVT